MIRTIGRSALLVAAGLYVCTAGPSSAAAAATDDATTATKPETAGAPVALHKYARHASHHGKKSANHGSSKVALKPSAGEKTADAANDGGHSSPIPPSVANANAQLTPAQPTSAQPASADTPTDNAAKAMTARANDILQATPDKATEASAPADAQSNAQVVSADQLNDVDRALRESPPAASMPPAVAVASAEAPAAPVAESSRDSSAWDQTSLVGKIFIGFGALLTMASAARMFMA
jgi:hypothetical protein